MASQHKPKKKVQLEVEVHDWMTVDVSLEDFETQDLIDELCRRGASTTGLGNTGAERAYLALPKDAPEALREFVAASAGRIW